MMSMLGSLAVRRIAAFLAAAGLCALTVLPDEHRHVVDTPGHHVSTVHRHFAPHEFSTHTEVRHDHSSGHRAVWSSGTFVQPDRLVSVMQPALVDAIAAIVIAVTQDLASRGPVDDLLTHDPPLISHGLRAPPALLS